jgi:hypothetical protein
MNAEALTLQPVAELAKRAAGDLQHFAEREPGKAAAAAACAFLALSIIPARVIVGTATALAKPALLTLGIIKAFEMCRNANSPSS